MNPLYESRTETLVSPNNQNPTKRTARFLKPIARNLDNVSEIPKTPFVSDIFSVQNLQKWPLMVFFTGWNPPQKNWVGWFNRLVIHHATTWIKAGIYDGILASLHEIPCNKGLVLGVSEFWCSKTNTFIFPWGEATITLEDVMILGGFPVIGGSINKLTEENDDKFVIELKRVRTELSEENLKNNGRNEVTHLAWLDHFMDEEEEGEIENKEGEFEHVAFLSLWLSRFVFPDLNEGIIDDFVFPVATHLSKGIPFEIAQSVLANLYHELTLLTQNVIAPPLDSKHYTCGLFKIVQLWVCERFPEFGAKLAKTLEIGDPRVVKWENVNFEYSLSLVRSRLKVGENFQWRPYASNLKKWEQIQWPFYDELDQIVSDYADLDDPLLSFRRFLYTCELNGHEMKYKEMYQPHRVAMQFGYDQDLPGQFIVPAFDCDKVGFYIPSRSFCSGISVSYYNWWKNSMLYHEEVVNEYFWPKRDKCISESSVERQLMLETNASSDLDNVPLALRVRQGSRKPIEIETKGYRVKSNSVGIDQMPLDLRRVSNVEENVAYDSLDIDHMPFALRLATNGLKKARLKPPDSYDSIENVQLSDSNSHFSVEESSVGKTSTDPERDVKDSISRLSSKELLASLARIEKDLAVLKTRVIYD
ncbi:unnamed protein product [Amaranthus hypochondriacus]